MSVPTDDLPGCELSPENTRTEHDCENKGTIVIKRHGEHFHVCPDAWLNWIDHDAFETVRKLA